MFQGNPLIESLPPRVEEDEIIKQLQHRPPYSEDQRLASREDRGMLVQILLRLFQPFEKDIDIYRRIERCIRWAYTDRNPFNPAFIRQQQHEYRAQLQKSSTIPYTQRYPTTSGFALHFCDALTGEDLGLMQDYLNLMVPARGCRVLTCRIEKC